MNLYRTKVTALFFIVALAILSAGAAHSHAATEQGGSACAVCHAAHAFGVVESVAAVSPPAIEPMSVPMAPARFVATILPSDVSTRGPPSSVSI